MANGQELSNEVQEFCRFLKASIGETKNRVVFLAGAGLGVDSNLAVVEDVLRTTFNSLGLYSDAEEKLQSSQGIPFGSEEQFQFLLGNVQPELIYSLLLQCSGKNQECLNGWKSLRKDSWNRDYYPRPSLVHMFIVAYSYLAGVPILSMNFDSMFEDAFTLLWSRIHPKNAGPAPVTVLNFKEQPPNIDTKYTTRHLYICKLHGDVAGGTGSISADSIKTTLSSICKYEYSWAQFVCNQAKNEHLCLVGYSGRDTDFYPEIKRAASSNRQTFWFVGPEAKQNNETLANAQGLKSSLITSWPRQTVKHCLEDGLLEDESLGSAMSQVLRDYSASFNPPTKEAKDRFFQRLSAANTCKKLVNPHLFWLYVYDSIGRNRKVSVRLNNSAFQGALKRLPLETHENDILDEIRMHNARELACFCQYYQIATGILSKPDQSPTNELVLRARREQVSALQMAIPHNLGFPLPVSLRLVIRPYNCLVAYLFCQLNSYFERLPAEDYQNNIVTIQESLLRELALQLRNTSQHEVKDIERKLLNLKQQAREVGNYTTYTGVERYLARLDAIEQGEHREKIKSTVMITGENNYLNIAQIDAGEYDKAIAEACCSGNLLNEIKALLHKAYAHHTQNQTQDNLLEDAELERLLQLAPLIESRLWRFALQDILWRYFKISRAELNQRWAMGSESAR
ncbi:SIR2 family protein [uncultured Varibaculum sp.]|uniref:SIR2 family protein n=1 Tax=uncultured Varibaculum sp. TaxID=413896 RepID=UPI002593F8C6|nr:SIR2 family protein [uncultured Varibaculum sp.]